VRGALVAVGAALVAAGAGAALACGSSFSSSGGDAGADAASDNATETAPPGDGGATDDGMRPCLDQHTFCDDFDSIDAASALAQKWNPGTLTAGGGILAIADHPFVSAPHSLGVSLAADASPPPSAMTLEHYVVDGGAFSSVSCAFDVQVEVNGGNGGSVVTLFRLGVFGGGGDPVSSLQMNLNVTGDLVLTTVVTSTSALDGGTSGGYPQVEALASGRWFHVRVDVGGGAAGNTKIAVDGADKATVTAPVPTLAGLVDFDLGGAAFAKPPGWTLHFDDFYCDVAP
jgi:hypothetical protein